MEMKAPRSLNDKRKRKLFRNWYYLTVLQIAQYVLPFVPIPYLVRVLSPEKFGLVAFAAAMAQFFSVFVEYGFSYSAVKRIAVNKKDKRKVEEIFSCAVIIKAVIACVLASVFVPLVLFVPQIYGEKTVFIFAFFMIFADIFLPPGFFRAWKN